MEPTAMKHRRPFDTRQLRACFAKFATGVTIVTVNGQLPHATTVNAFASLSLDPPLSLICLQHGSRILRLIEEAGSFAVNILSHKQAHLAAYFASPNRELGAAQFAGIELSTDPDQNELVFAGTVGHLECKILSTHPEGDHCIVIGEVISMANGVAEEPLIFFDGKIDPPLPPPTHTMRPPADQFGGPK